MMIYELMKMIRIIFIMKVMIIKNEYINNKTTGLVQTNLVLKTKIKHNKNNFTITIMIVIVIIIVIYKILWRWCKIDSRECKMARVGEN